MILYNYVDFLSLESVDLWSVFNDETSFETSEMNEKEISEYLRKEKHLILD